MNSKVVSDIILSSIIALGGSLLLLFSQANVHNFSDISPVSYTIALITAAIGVAKTVQSRLGDDGK